MLSALLEIDKIEPDAKEFFYETNDKNIHSRHIMQRCIIPLRAECAVFKQNQSEANDLDMHLLHSREVARKCTVSNWYVHLNRFLTKNLITLEDNQFTSDYP